MKHYNQFYINGEWVNPLASSNMDIINPATEEIIGELALGSAADVERAVEAAKAAFKTWSLTSREQRLALLDSIIAIYKERMDEMARAISDEMGAPMTLACGSQAPIGISHFNTSRKALENYVFEQSIGTTRVFKEPIGVCGFITPWNWPMNQIACKVAPALACGCTMVLKPSELAPLSSRLFCEIMHEAGVPAGVFNMVNGEGVTVGEAISSHKDIEMVSLTGSTRAGIAVSKAAAETVKRVTLELGGKSANIILDDADIEKAVAEGAAECFSNTGQSCNAPTRMLIPEKFHDQAVEIAVKTAQQTKVGDPENVDTDIGPLSNKNQFKKVQAMIQTAIDDGTELVTGGIGRPEGISKGYYVRPTVFAHVDNSMMIAQQEIFGPVLAILPYKDDEHAVEIANDSAYGLASYVQSSDMDRARSIAKQLRSGNVFINGHNHDANAPFGGYKQSGNGREWGDFAFHDFLEIKGVVGYGLK